jgi:hypothetical protein
MNQPDFADAVCPTCGRDEYGEPFSDPAPLADTRGAVCPLWHLMPGPYDSDEGKRECPLRDTHKAQRQEWEAALVDGHE